MLDIILNDGDFLGLITKLLQSLKNNIWLLGSMIVHATSAYPLALKKNWFF